MNRMASQVLTSAENTADSAKAPTNTGRSLSSTVGSTLLMLSMPGWFTRAAIPNKTGRNENTSWIAPAAPIPMRTARWLSAPNAFCTSPGEMMNDGVNRMSIVQPDAAPDENMGSQNVAGTPGAVAMADVPPTPDSTNGSAITKPPISTTSCTAFTHAELSNPPAVK